MGRATKFPLVNQMPLSFPLSFPVTKYFIYNVDLVNELLFIL